MKTYLLLAIVLINTAACQAENPTKVQTTSSAITALQPTASASLPITTVPNALAAVTTNQATQSKLAVMSPKPVLATVSAPAKSLKPVAETATPLTEALNSGLRNDFKKHLRTYHTAVQSWPDAKLTQFVDAGSYKAWSYDFKNPRAIVKFLSLQVVLGEDFDTNSRYPWAKTILAQPENPKDNQARITKLFDTAVKHLQANGQ